MSKTVTIKGFVAWRKSRFMGDPEFIFRAADMTGVDGFEDEVMVKRITIEAEIPADFDPVPKQVAALEAEKRKVKAAFAKRVMEIDAEISKLTCITMEVKS